MKKYECTHDPSMDDETQHWLDDQHFWFLMRCDDCHKLLKVFATIDWEKTEELIEQ